MEFHMDEKAGAQISKKAFIQSFAILLLLMIIAGVLTRVLPTGSYERFTQAGRTLIDPASFHLTDQANLPIWRWFTAPVETLWGPDALVIITIIVFILLVSSAFAVLDKSGILKATLGKIVNRFGGRKYVLLLIVSFFFMLLGAFFGLFEEIVPLVPLMIALAYSLGWDALVGLGMSILATNMGFSAAITNPFTIGVAQKLAGLPYPSGALFRVPIFIAVYAALAWFLVSYARKIDRKPEASLLFKEDQADRKRYTGFTFESNANLGRAGLLWHLHRADHDHPLQRLVRALPLGLLFAYRRPALLHRRAGRRLHLWSQRQADRQSPARGHWRNGPGHPPHSHGGQHQAHHHQWRCHGYNPAQLLRLAAERLSAQRGADHLPAGPGDGALHRLGWRQAVLMMPILLPLADLVGVTRQLSVTAYCFGDGFSNMAYPTNPVLLIAIGLASVGYGKWMKWTWKLWAVIIPITLFFLWLGNLIGYGPF
jgi:uncharacterized ion transporter superfamily protein YfcC